MVEEKQKIVNQNVNEKQKNDINHDVDDKLKNDAKNVKHVVKNITNKFKQNTLNLFNE